MEKSCETRSLILDKATELFAAKGYDGVGVQEICAESKITKPTLYYYFGSKTGLLSAIIEEKGSVFYEILGLASEYNRDFIGSLTKILTTTVDFAKENPDFFRLHSALKVTSVESEAGKLYEPFSAKIQELIEVFFRNSSSEIGNMKGKEKLFSKIFFQIAESVSLDAIQNRLEISDAVIFSIIHSFVYGVAAG